MTDCELGALSDAIGEPEIVRRLDPTRPVFVMPDGRMTNLFNTSVEGERQPVNQFPRPTDFNSYEEFLAAVGVWKRTSEDAVKSLLLPVPMSSCFKAMGMPHVPTSQEKIPMTLQNRMAAKAWSLQTPLYPENYLLLTNYVLDGSEEHPEAFPVTGPRGQTIPFSAHFTKDTPWSGALIRQKPLPQFYKTYEEYATAMKEWASSSKETVRIPMHPDEFEDRLGIPMQKDEPIIRETIHKDHSHVEFKPVRAAVYSECKLSQTLDLLYGEVDRYVKSGRPIEIPMSFGPKIQPCTSIVKEFMTTGPISPKRDKDLPYGCACSSIYSHTLPSVCNDKKLIDMMIDMYNTKLHKHLFYTFIKEVFNAKGDLKDWILSDSQRFYKVYSIFGEFSDCIHDIPTMFDVDSFSPTLQEDKAILVTLQNIFVTLYMSQQMGETYTKKDPAKAVFDRNTKMLTDMGEAFLMANREVFVKVYMIMEDSDMKYLLDLLFVVLSTSTKSNVRKVLDCFKESLLLVFYNVYERQPAVFKAFTAKLIKSQWMSTIMFEEMTRLTASPMKLLTPRSAGDKNDDYTNWLIQLINCNIKNASPKADFSWILVYVTGIVNNIIIMGESVSLQVLLLKIFEFCSVIELGPRLSQLESVLFSAFTISSDPAVHLTLLRCLKLVICKKDTEKFLLEIKGFGAILGNMIKNENAASSCYAVKVLREMIVWHPKITCCYMGNENEFGGVVTALARRRWRVNLELLKLILRVSKKHSNSRDLAALDLFLRIINFRVTASLENVKGQVDIKHRHIVYEFEQLLSKKSHIVTLMYDIEKVLRTSGNSDPRLRKGYRKSMTPNAIPM